jgi:hypothetical protein
MWRRCAAPSREECFDDVTAMHRCPIPDDHQTAWHLPQQMLQKGHDICRVERPFLAANIPLALRRDGADGREMITGPPFFQNRGADRTGQRLEPGFVDEHDALPPSLCPL